MIVRQQGKGERGAGVRRGFRGVGETDRQVALELKLHQLVCDKTHKLKDAQDAIRKDWVKAYNQYVKGAK